MPPNEITPKYRPSLEAHEIIGLVQFMSSHSQEITNLGLQPALAKMSLMSHKIQNNFARPAYVATGISAGRAGHSGESLGIMLIDETGELELSRSPADMARGALAKKLALTRATITQGNIQAMNVTISGEVNNIIQSGVAEGDQECINAVNKFYELLSTATQTTTQTITTEYWKYISREWLESALTQAQFNNIMNQRGETV